MERRRFVRLKSVPKPLPAFTSKRRREDKLWVVADHHSLIVSYEAELRDCNRHWPTAVIVQFIGFRHYTHTSIGREDLAAPKHRAAVKIKETAGGITLEMQFQGSRLRVAAAGYRVYAIKEPEYDIDDRELISSESLVAKRAYWEKQLREIHFPVFDKVNSGNKEAIWQRIQERYLFRYSEFLRIEPDWCSSGIWGISFPGSFGTTPNYSYECFKLPKRVVQRFKKWQGLYDSRDPVDDGNNADFDWPAFHREGELLARELKRVVGPDTYVEYKPGREIR